MGNIMKKMETVNTKKNLISISSGNRDIEKTVNHTDEIFVKSKIESHYYDAIRLSTELC